MLIPHHWEQLLEYEHLYTTLSASGREIHQEPQTDPPEGDYFAGPWEPQGHTIANGAVYSSWKRPIYKKYIETKLPETASTHDLWE